MAGSGPSQSDRLYDLTTTHRSVAFYFQWFFQTFELAENGWVRVRTPDGESIMRQDAFFVIASDTIARKLNEIRAHEIWKATQGQ